VKIDGNKDGDLTMKLTAKRLKQIIREVMEESTAYDATQQRDMQYIYDNDPTKSMPSNPATKIVNNINKELQRLRDAADAGDKTALQRLIDLQGNMGMPFGQ